MSTKVGNLAAQAEATMERSRALRDRLQKASDEARALFEDGERILSRAEGILDPSVKRSGLRRKLDLSRAPDSEP